MDRIIFSKKIDLQILVRERYGLRRICKKNFKGKKYFFCKMLRRRRSGGGGESMGYTVEGHTDETRIGTPPPPSAGLPAFMRNDASNTDQTTNS